MLLDATTPGAELVVCTFKEGVLAAAGHDLRLRFERFVVEFVAPASLTVTAFADSLSVVTALVRGEVADGALSKSDKLKIARVAREEVLEAGRFPTITFQATSISADGDAVHIAGDVTLKGHRRALRLEAQQVGDRLVVTCRVHQPDFGLKPYSAMFGALRIKADVEVTATMPAAPFLASSPSAP
ncbi:MAG: YceI family protein [Myxococcales bacterium]|nr:YceI family protein [Myxococcales bacterium]